MSKKLNFLSIRIFGHPLIEDGTEFSLLNAQRMTEKTVGSLTPLFGTSWLNNINILVGKNASGKTTIMKFILGVTSLMLNNKSISQTRLSEVLIGKSDIKIETLLCGSDGFLYKDDIVFRLGNDRDWFIKEEKIFKKKVTTRMAKSGISDFSESKPFMNRSQLEDNVAAVLSPDDSLFRSVISLNKYKAPTIMDTLFSTNFNAFIYNASEVPSEILEYLDPSVEYLKIDFTDDRKAFYRLKFKNRDEEITNTNFITIELYLSSGTYKGIMLYQWIMSTLRTGGIICIDELENHFNHAIARTFMEFFSNPNINVNHAVLIFSTHYAEFLDDIERNDQVFIAMRKDKISLTRYSETEMRSDISKSEVFMADDLDGTSPSYESYVALKKATMSLNNQEDVDGQ